MQKEGFSCEKVKASCKIKKEKKRKKGKNGISSMH
jgi:hypothetical protein